MARSTILLRRISLNKGSRACQCSFTCWISFGIICILNRASTMLWIVIWWYVAKTMLETMMNYRRFFIMKKASKIVVLFDFPLDFSMHSFGCQSLFVLMSPNESFMKCFFFDARNASHNSSTIISPLFGSITMEKLMEFMMNFYKKLNTYDEFPYLIFLTLCWIIFMFKLFKLLFVSCK